MGSIRHSLESGIGSEDCTHSGDSNSALKYFFKSYLPRLETAVQGGLTQDDFEDDELMDPTIELDGDLGKGLAIRAPSPIRHREDINYRNNSQQTDHIHIAANNTFNISTKKDPTLEELEFMVEQFKRKNNYSYKLIDIILKGAEKTLGPEMYREFIQGRLQENWLPIVRMNNDNTPYLEFLIKSDVADQDPASQLSDYTMNHILYSKYIVAHLCDSVKSVKLAAAQNTRPNQQITPQRQQQQHQPQQQKSQTKVQHYPPLNCSTPISQKKVPQAKRLITTNPKSKENLNDSKRILPLRACKSNTSGQYRIPK